MNDAAPTKRSFVDASVFITLAEIDYVDLLDSFESEVIVPQAVAEEVADEPAASHLDAASDEWLRVVDTVDVVGRQPLEHAATHLDADFSGSPPSDSGSVEGDVALLALGTTAEDPVVVTDDKPLRKACKALGVPVSGSIGVIVAAVERGRLDVAEAKDALVAMDEVGARLSARLLRRAERLIDDAGD
ncbi:DUF3368 domain-containing protein [Halorussus sp. AFM4]|uniref:DUF3368 domain-containing protein n=1 Tax=Halorussus sp. AFM4 TaxID=3421651 RepID=UPI003EB94DA0